MQDWLDALARMEKDQPDGVTIREFSENTGMRDKRAQEVMRQLIAGKLAVCAGRRKTLAIDGTMRPTPVYKLLSRRKQNV